ncbi:MAG: hypothetical protein HYY18_18660 [Planctomycetes bacterium]|nr:hypothetical protein [Planctomycetota bacterium]
MKHVPLILSLASLAVCAALFIQVRALRNEQASRPAAEPRAREEAAADAPRKDAPEDRALEDKLDAQAASIRAMQEEFASLQEKLKGLKVSRKPAGMPAGGEEARRREPLQVGQEPSKEMLEALGLDALGEAALRQALKDEEARIIDGLRKCYLEMVDPADHRLEDRSGQEMIMALANKLKPEMAEVDNLPDESRERLNRQEISIEELLGEANRISRVARMLHAARVATYDDLARRLTPEQIAALRKNDLPEGTFKWPNDVDLEIGPAPPDLKR